MMIELNPGPKSNSGQDFSVCHWNLNNILVHNFSNISFLRTYNCLHVLGIICLLDETYLGSCFLPQDPNLEMQGTRTKVTIINNLMPKNGLTQIIHEPTHLLDCSSSFIDLIFDSQDNLVTNSKVHFSLHSNCHHQIIFSKSNLKIHYPKPYECVAWDYDKANKDLITKAINAFDWDKKLSERCVNNQVLLFNEIILHVMNICIPKKMMIFNDMEPPWSD